MPPRRHPSPPREEVADALGRVAPLVTRWTERLLARHDPPLTPAQYAALRAIADGEALGADLARRTGVSAAAVSQLLAGLEGAGLIRRPPEAGDRRRRALALTPAGERVLASARAEVSGRLAGLIEDLPRPEAEALGRLLPRLEALLGDGPPPRRPPPRPGPRTRGPAAPGRG